jgi:hypothetical protein
MSPFGKLRATLDAERLASNNCAEEHIFQKSTLHTLALL